MTPAGTLRVCGTPIGNLGDLTPRVATALAAAAVIACEDTRRTGSLLAARGIGGARLVRLDAHTEAQAVPKLLARLTAGDDVCLVTDAGMPGISDPGRRLVDDAFEAGHRVEVLPGPSAVTAAVAIAGIEAGTFAFVGFLPRAAKALAALLDTTDAWQVAVVAFEAPHRLPATLAAIAARAPERRVAVCRELTKLHEEVVRGPAADVARRFAESPHGEVTLVLAALDRMPHAAADADVDAALAGLRAGGMSHGEAAALIARLTGATRRSVYSRGTGG
jgi:16S rRNA (cytidine1402-2'-O)-methyltransferase